MSVVMEFAIFPTDKGIHVSKYVKPVIEMLDELPYHTQLTAMGTLVECPTMNECLEVISKANKLLETKTDRIYCVATFDNKLGQVSQMEHKVKAVRSKED